MFAFDASSVLNSSCVGLADNYWYNVHGYDLAPVDTSSYNGEDVIEMPNSYVGSYAASYWCTGTVPSVSCPLDGTVGTLQWLSESADVVVRQHEWDTSYGLILGDADAPQGLAYSDQYLGVTANGVDSSAGRDYAVEVFVEFTTTSAGEVDGVTGEYEIAAGDGAWQKGDEYEFYYGTLTGADNNGWLGSFDWICEEASGGVCGNPYSSTEPFELFNEMTIETLGTDHADGNYYENCNFVYCGSDAPDVPWGDVDGCSYVSGSSPPEAICTGEFADSTTSPNPWSIDTFDTQWT